MLCNKVGQQDHKVVWLQGGAILETPTEAHTELKGHDCHAGTECHPEEDSTCHTWDYNSSGKLKAQPSPRNKASYNRNIPRNTEDTRGKFRQHFNLNVPAISIHEGKKSGRFINMHLTSFEKKPKTRGTTTGFCFYPEDEDLAILGRQDAGITLQLEIKPSVQHTDCRELPHKAIMRARFCPG